MTQEIRTEPLTKEEKAKFTRLLQELRMLPQNGGVVLQRVTLHCNNGKVARVEPRYEI